MSRWSGSAELFLARYMARAVRQSFDGENIESVGSWLPLPAPENSASSYGNSRRLCWAGRPVELGALSF